MAPSRSHRIFGIGHSIFFSDFFLCKKATTSAFQAVPASFTGTGVLLYPGIRWPHRSDTPLAKMHRPKQLPGPPGIHNIRFTATLHIPIIFCSLQLLCTDAIRLNSPRS